MNNFIKVENIKAGAKKAFELSKNSFYKKTITNIAITGGAFGKEFAEVMSKSKNIKNRNIFLTDERISPILSEQNSNFVIKIFCKNKFLEKNNFHHFSQDFLSDLNQPNDLEKRFDLCLLSLGEDGHLAGHFENSKEIGNKYCFTNNAKKKPKKRISYSVKWLFSSKKIIIAVFGVKKKKALKDFIEGRSYHSEQYKKSIKKIVFLTDLNI